MADFLPGCTSREDEIALYQRLSSLAGGAGGDPTPALPGPPLERAPDPIADPQAFQAYLDRERATQDQRVDQRFQTLRQEQDETARRNQLWTEFRAEHPDLSHSTQVVNAAFQEETGGDFPTSQEGAEELKAKIAKRVRGWGVGAMADDKPPGAEDEPKVAPSDVVFPVPEGVSAPPGEEAEQDRTTGIQGGSHEAPKNTAPTPEDDGPNDLVEALQQVRNSPEMAGFF